MSGPDGGEDLGGTLPAGSFAAWLGDLHAALRGGADADVPCGSCTACCTASQFIHVGPDEADALAAIPPSLRFPAPGLPAGHVVLGYDEQGRCPMFVDGACSIYAVRPRACRTYDCRIFAATGLDPAVDGKDGVARQAARWRFSFPTDADRRLEAAVRDAVARVAEDQPGLDRTRLAVTAVQSVPTDPPSRR